MSGIGGREGRGIWVSGRERSRPWWTIHHNDGSPIQRTFSRCLMPPDCSVWREPGRIVSHWLMSCNWHSYQFCVSVCVYVCVYACVV